MSDEKLKKIMKDVYKTIIVERNLIVEKEQNKREYQRGYYDGKLDAIMEITKDYMSTICDYFEVDEQEIFDD